MTRLLVSVPVHEHPVVILDQVENLRAFLPAATQVVLHVSASLPVDRAELDAVLPPGVHVNPTQHTTRWGDVVHVHNDNVRWAAGHLDPFDTVVLNASNDVYFRTGAEAYIDRAGAGFTARPVPPDTTWAWGAAAHRDPVVAALLDDLGRPEGIFGGQWEGSFFPAGLFLEMAERIDRRFTPGEGEEYVREELYYGTLAAHLHAGEHGAPLVYSDAVSENKTPVTPGLIWALRDDAFREHGLEDVADLFAVKRAARDLRDPNRTLIRTLGRARTGRPRLAPPFEARSFVGLAFAADVVADPSLLAPWMKAFGPDDDATLALHVAPAQGALVPDLVAAVEEAGGSAEGAPDLTVFTVAPGGFGEAALRWAVDVVLSPPGGLLPSHLDDALLLRPGAAARLRDLAAAVRQVRL